MGACIRRTTRLLAAVSAAVGIGLAGASPAIGVGPAHAALKTSAAGADEQALAKRFAPVLKLVSQLEPCGPGEPYQPTDVDVILPSPEVALRGPWLDGDLIQVGPDERDLARGLTGYALDFPGNPLSPGCDYETWAQRITAGTAPTMYAHVVTQDGRDNRLAVQYWFYYLFNDYNNKHEGDWEMIQLLFDTGEVSAALNQDPVQVAYSQHEGAEVADWDDPKLEIVGGTHPVVHVAAGSHANFYDPALFLGTSGEQGFGCDDTRTPTDSMRPQLVVIPSDPDAARDAFGWIAYEGQWGQRATAFYNGPTGPNAKAQWAEPVTFQQTEGRDRSFAVPVGGLLGTRTTDFFCEGVAAGSSFVRVLVDSPGPLLLVVALVALLAIWLVRRTTWRPSAPLRLRRSRAAGQILVAATRIYGGHWRLFLGIGVILIPVFLAVSALQTLLVNAPEVGGVSQYGEDGGFRVALAAAIGFLALGIAIDFVLAACTVALGEIDAGGVPGVRRAYAGSLGRLRPLITAFLVASALVGMFTVTVLLSPVAIGLILAFALYVPVIVFEDLGGVAALRRSAALVRHEAVKVAGLLAISLVLASALGPVLGTALLLIADAPFLVVNMVAGATFAFALPYVALTIAYAYNDALVTKHRASQQVPQPSVLPAEV